MPYYPQWQIWPDYQGQLWSSERRDDITISRSWHFVRPDASTLVRITQELTLSLFALPNMIRSLWGCVAAYVVSPPLSFAFTACIVAKALNVRCTLIVHDVMPDTAVELGMLTNSRAITVARWLARIAYSLADEIHTLGEGMRERIATQCGRPNKVRVVPITIDAAELAPVEREQNEFRRRFVPADTFAVLHTGNMGRKQDLDILLRVADRLRDHRSIHFYVFGEGAAKLEFLRKLSASGLNNVTHYPLQERWLLRHMLSGADLVLVSQQPEVVDIVVPSKLITSLAAGAMLVVACNPDSETAQLVSRNECGILVAAGDDAAFAQTILALIRGEVESTSYQSRARETALRCFDRERVYTPMAEELSGLLEMS
jgi:colanic acid biosynthesis glycosyl transferase WcaI